MHSWRSLLRYSNLYSAFQQWFSIAESMNPEGCVLDCLILRRQHLKCQQPTKPVKILLLPLRKGAHANFQDQVEWKAMNLWGLPLAVAERINRLPVMSSVQEAYHCHVRRARNLRKSWTLHEQEFSTKILQVYEPCGLFQPQQHPQLKIGRETTHSLRLISVCDHLPSALFWLMIYNIRVATVTFWYNKPRLYEIHDVTNYLTFPILGALKTIISLSQYRKVTSSRHFDLTKILRTAYAHLPLWQIENRQALIERIFCGYLSHRNVAGSQ